MNPERLTRDYEELRYQHQICRRKLESKCEALLIISKEVDECRSERDQFKLMAEQLRERYQALKRQVAGRTPRSNSLEQTDPSYYSDMKNHSLAQLLCDVKEQNKSLQFEKDDLKQKLFDAQGDIKLLREQIARQRVGTTDEGMNTRHFPAHEREDLVKQLEASREQYCQLEKDLQQVLDEKEEYVTERDAYKHKYERLNQELNYILKGDEKRVVDIDALVMENKYLQERLKQMEEEKSIAMATVSKYKNILERKKTKGIMKLGQSRSGGVIISQKQVHQLLENKMALKNNPQAISDLQALASALLETVNDKNLALSHQRKTNKILGNRVNELEKKLKTLEVSGLWNIPGRNISLDNLKLECKEVKTLIPRQASESSDLSGKSDKMEDIMEDLESDAFMSPTGSHEASPAHSSTKLNSPLNQIVSMEDLDLLPTKEEAQKHILKEDHNAELLLLKQELEAIGEGLDDLDLQEGSHDEEEEEEEEENEDDIQCLHEVLTTDLDVTGAGDDDEHEEENEEECDPMARLLDENYDEDKNDIISDNDDDDDDTESKLHALMQDATNRVTSHSHNPSSRSDPETTVESESLLSKSPCNSPVPGEEKQPLLITQDENKHLLSTIDENHATHQSGNSTVAKQHSPQENGDHEDVLDDLSQKSLLSEDNPDLVEV